MWFYTALITSVITAIIAIVGKKLVANVSASVLTWATLVLATPIIFIFVLKEGVPQLNYVFLLGVTGSVLFYTAFPFPKNTTFTLFIENLMVIFGLLPLLYMRNKNFYQQITGNTKLFLLLGALNALSTILAFQAVGGGSVGLVATILKTEVLFVLLFSYIAFKDKPKFETLMGSVVMIAGVVLIKIGL